MGWGAWSRRGSQHHLHPTEQSWGQGWAQSHCLNVRAPQKWGCTEGPPHPGAPIPPCDAHSITRMEWPRGWGEKWGGKKKQMEIPRQCCVLGVLQGSPEAMGYTEDAGGVKVLPSSVWYPGTGGWSSGRGNTFCGDTPNLTPGLGVHKAGGSGERGQQCLGSAEQHLGSSLEPLLPKLAMGRG